MARVKTGGRVKGSRNKRLKEYESAREQAARLIGEVLQGAFEGDAHAFLMATYKNPAFELHARQDAAKAALPYEKPRLSHKDVNLKADVSESFVKLWGLISDGDGSSAADRINSGAIDKGIGTDADSGKTPASSTV